MALLATEFSVEIIIWITAFAIMEGGLIRQIGAMGLYVTNIGMITTNQSFVSDLTSTPINVSTFFVGPVLVGWVLVNVILFFVTFGYFAVSLRVISKLDKPRDEVWEYLV